MRSDSVSTKVRCFAGLKWSYNRKDRGKENHSIRPLAVQFNRTSIIIVGIFSLVPSLVSPPPDEKLYYGLALVSSNINM